ncbi:hypothetical protein CKO12_10885 [Chromatium okenii]|uniref:zinc-finger domain-containing protein n=1 Tax=Chromatium okenii TaxID=61644 RepID=UPI001907EA3F|nr:zinc-finger domain-containing protein [Chromatium okenii]MBK1642373.1 hypothetical protein [Chromatium okenii]
MSTATLPQSTPLPVTPQDLPLSCPPAHTPNWNLHPRVFLPIEKSPNHEAICPYCGAHYVLTT